MKNRKINGLIITIMCIFSMLLFSEPTVYGGITPPPVTTQYIGPAVLVDLTFRQATDDEISDNLCGDTGDLVISGEARCKGETFQIQESFEFCSESDFENTNEETLNDFWIGEHHINWLLDLLPDNCFPNVSMDDFKGLVINVVTDYSEELDHDPPPPLKKAKAVMLFVRPKKAAQ